MTDQPRMPAVTATAAAALLVLLLAVLLGLHQELTPRQALYAGAAAYAATVLAAAARFAVPPDLVLARTLKWAGLTLAFSASVTVAGALAAVRTTRGAVA